jgi:hypothetical protein
VGCLFEPCDQPRENAGCRHDGHGKGVARRLAGVVLIHHHPDHRRNPDDQGREDAKEAIHQAMIALTPQLRPLLWLVPRSRPRPLVTQMRIVPRLELACTRRDDLRGASRIIMTNSRPAGTERPRAGLFLSRRGLATGRAGLLSAFDPEEKARRNQILRRTQ